MRDLLAVISKILTLACAAAFIGVALLGLFLYNLDRQVFSPAAYKRVLLEQKFYERVPSLAAGQIVTTLNRQPAGDPGGVPVYFRNLKRSDWEIILAGLMTPEWLQAQAETAIDQVFAYIDSAQASLAVRVSLVELKIRFQGEPGWRAFLQMLRAQPPCTEQQLLAIVEAAITSGLENLPLCLPPEDLLDRFRPDIQAELNRVAAQIPNELDLVRQLQDGDLTGQAADDPRQGIRMARLLIRASLLLSVGLLVLVAIFQVRSLRDWFFWWGVPVFLVGLAAIVVGIVASPAVSRSIASAFESGRLAGAELSPDLVQAIVGLIQGLARKAIHSSMLFGAGMALAGFGMIGVGVLIRPRSGSGY